MRKSTSKFIVVIIEITLLFNFIYSNYIPVFGTSEASSGDTENIELSPEEIIIKANNFIENGLGGIGSMYIWGIQVACLAVGYAAQGIITQVAYIDNTQITSNNILLTPYDIFFNEVQLLDINFFDLSTNGTIGVIRQQVAKWYSIMRTIAIIILLIILIYLGIRLSLSSVASEKASYKKTIVHWAFSIAIVFALHYFMVIVLNVNSALVNVLKEIVSTSTLSDSIVYIMGLALRNILASYGSYCSILFNCISNSSIFSKIC